MITKRLANIGFFRNLLRDSGKVLLQLVGGHPLVKIFASLEYAVERTLGLCHKAEAEPHCITRHLASMFTLCSITPLERIEPTFIAEAILTAPGWARVGITAPSSWTREDAARELAQSIIEKMQGGPPETSDGQIGLGL